MPTTMQQKGGSSRFFMTVCYSYCGEILVSYQLDLACFPAFAGQRQLVTYRYTVTQVPHRKQWVGKTSTTSLHLLSYSWDRWQFTFALLFIICCHLFSFLQRCSILVWWKRCLVETHQPPFSPIFFLRGKTQSSFYLAAMTSFWLTFPFGYTSQWTSFRGKRSAERAEHIQQQKIKTFAWPLMEMKCSFVCSYQLIKTVVPQSSAAPRRVCAGEKAARLALLHTLVSVHNHSKLFLDRSETGCGWLCTYHDSMSKQQRPHAAQNQTINNPSARRYTGPSVMMKLYIGANSHRHKRKRKKKEERIATVPEKITAWHCGEDISLEISNLFISFYGQYFDISEWLFVYGKTLAFM